MRLNKRQREQLPVMADFAEEIEGQLDSEGFDNEELWPAIYEARHHAGRLKAWLYELCFLAETEHGDRR